MTGPAYKVGTLLMRVSGQEPAWPMDIFEPGVMLKITKITKAMYFYDYLNLRPGQKGNCKFEEIEETCIIPSEMAKILYANSL